MKIYLILGKTRQKLHLRINRLSANPTKWSNTFKEFVGKSPTNCLSGSDHFLGLAVKDLIERIMIRIVFETLSNIHDEVFLQKESTL